MTRRIGRVLALAALGAVCLALPAAPARADEPCAGKPWWVETEARFEDFDFWIGEWQVYATDSGELRGFDEIQKVLSGCTVSQHWRQMDDLFSPPGADRRLQGMSLSGIDAEGRWRQVWTDNGGANLIFTGGLEDDGTMVLASEWYDAPRQKGGTVKMRNLWHWKPVDERTIHNWGYYQLENEDGEKTKYFDITYKKSALGGPAAKSRSAE